MDKMAGSDDATLLTLTIEMERIEHLKQRRWAFSSPCTEKNSEKILKP
jgi:hypothetical protein